MTALRAISDREFALFQRFIYESAGITLADTKKALVSGRLSRRLSHCRVSSYGAYFELLASGRDRAEVQAAIDLLTTNETYFFREPRHFEVLKKAAERHATRVRRPMRVWSAACSTGEEPYSIAMVLADVLGTAPWEVVGTDISARVLERARSGHYPLERTEHIPPNYLKTWCLRGIEGQAGTLLIERSLRERVRFVPANLNTELPEIGRFDVIFLRNVMIYFNAETRRGVARRVFARLLPGGTCCVGHAESLGDTVPGLVAIAPSVYEKKS